MAGQSMEAVPGIGQGQSTSVRGHPRILIVDDERAAIRFIHAALEGIGQVRFATSGAEALVQVESEPVDLVLLDAQMPDIDGFATCQSLHQAHPDIPVIFLTAAIDSVSHLQALEVGASDFLSKPIDPRLIRARVGLHLKLKQQSDRLRELSGRDPLTGLANRRLLDEQLRREWRRAARHRLPLGLFMADIDDFKAYNDHYGHLRGDACLRDVAQALTTTVTRAGDLVARYGGEEFAVLLPGSTLAEVVALAEKSTTAVRQLEIRHAGSRAASFVTLSIGAASLIPATEPSSVQSREPSSACGSVDSICQEEDGFYRARALFEAADHALYAAKSDGRNRVCASTR